MDKNILENAKFGDKFRTRGGKCAILRIKHYLDDVLDECYLITPDDDIYVGPHGISKDGKSYRDIVLPWEEPIHEYELRELAFNEWHHNENNTVNDFQSGFVAGYKKALKRHKI